MSRTPTLYIPHGGGPCFFMDWNPPDLWAPMGDFLKQLAATLPERPKAILLISAHWEGSAFTVGSNANPRLIYDYFGFPAHTYELKYPAPGHPALAQRVKGLLEEAGLKAADDPVRGYDHGVFIPLKLVYPDADIPIVQLSLRADYDPAAHLAAGAALAPLRDEGVLIIGSGMSFHNMALMRDPRMMANGPNYANGFHNWLDTAIVDPETRVEALSAWEKAPYARQSHPVRGEEHLLPLMVAAGAAANDTGSVVYSSPPNAMIQASGYRFG